MPFWWRAELMVKIRSNQGASPTANVTMIDCCGVVCQLLIGLNHSNHFQRVIILTAVVYAL